MVPSRRFLRPAILIAVTAGLGLPTSLAGQLAVSRSNAPILVMDPIPDAQADTTYALDLADALRTRMASKYRFQLRIIPTETISEAKVASGFEASHIFPAANAPALARFLQAQGMIVSWVTRGADSVRLRMRLVNTAGAGLSGWMRVAGPSGISATDFGRQVAEALEQQIEAAEDARECDQRRSQSDFRRARDRVRDAFELYPDHPAAAMCAALLFEVQGTSVDSIVWALEKAVRGDSALGDAWEMLGRRLVERGDTARAIDAFLMQLNAEPGNIRLRQAIAGQMVAMGDYRRADSLISPAIEFNPNDLTLLVLKEQACYEGMMWHCALETMEQTFELDSARQASLDFKFKAFSGAQSWEHGDSTHTPQPDSAAPYLLRWSERLVEHDSTNPAVLRARAAALTSPGVNRPMEAVEVYRRLMAVDTARATQVSAAYAAATILWDSTTLVIDSTQALDTARMFLGDSLWTRVATLQTDDNTLTNIAVRYYGIGNKLVGQRMRLPLAHRYLQRAIELDRSGSLTAPANFFAGLADFFQLIPQYQALVASERCADIPPLMERASRTRTELQAGQTVSAQVVGQLMPTVQQIVGARDALRQNFCR